MHRLVRIMLPIVLVLALSCIAQANGSTAPKPGVGAGAGAGPQANDQMNMQEQQGVMPGQTVPAEEGAGPGMAPGAMSSMVHGITVDDTAVYVVRGNQILKLDKNTLAVIRSSTLPPPSAQTMGAGAQTGAGPQTSKTMAMQLCDMQPAEAERVYMETVYQSQLGAIEWSRLAQDRATRADLRRFAGRAIDRLSGLNIRFSSWLRSWYGARPSQSMLASDRATLSELQNLDGRAFDIAYMQAMIDHFQNTIDITGSIQERAPHTELRQVSVNTADEYRADVQQLRTWLSEWYGVTM